MKKRDVILKTVEPIQIGSDGIACVAQTKGVIFQIIASWGGNWEHASVCVVKPKQRCPTWKEMCFIKSIFWKPSECVVQYHPSAKDYINNHSDVLHLWRPIKEIMPMPPKSFV